MPEYLIADDEYWPQEPTDHEAEGYSPAEIVKLFTPARGLQGHEAAMIMQAFWPTIEKALLVLDKATDGAKVKPIRVPLD